MNNLKFEADSLAMLVLLAPAIGVEIPEDISICTEGVEPYHPEAIRFTCESPDPRFRGFKVHSLVEVPVLVGDEEYATAYLQRYKKFIFYFLTRHAGAQGYTHYVYGQALKCPENSAKEKAFITAAVKDTLHTAAESLRTALFAVEESGLPLLEPVESMVQTAITAGNF